MEAKRLNRIKADQQTCERLKRRYISSGLVLARLAEALGMAPRAISRWFNLDQTYGPSTLKRVNDWLDACDRGEVDLEPLRIDRRTKS